MKAVKNALGAVWGLLRTALTKIRRLIGLAAQTVIQRDQLYALKVQTERLGTASVESATYVAWELREVQQRVSEVDERLSRLEEDLAKLRRLLEEQREGVPSS